MRTVDATLRAVKEWEGFYFSIYKKKPTMRDREQFFLGMIYGPMVDQWRRGQQLPDAARQDGAK